MKVLVTCPPMLKRIDSFRPLFEEKGIGMVAPEVVQVMTVPELLELVPQMDGWIIGDDPANREVFTAGVQGQLKAAVKWGVGVDNVDFEAAKALNLPITNTPGMFGEEVSDVAMGMLINLARELHHIDREVRKGNWYKPAGMSLHGKKAAVIGYGDIGKACVRKLKAFGLETVAYDPFALDNPHRDLKFPEGIADRDLVMITCALTPETFHMINAESIAKMKAGVMIINVSRGPVIDESALISGLQSRQVGAAGLEVLEVEPLDVHSPLAKMPQVFLGSHNGSNTIEAVDKTSRKAIRILFDYLGL